jgi:hypothetical protein
MASWWLTVVIMNELNRLRVRRLNKTYSAFRTLALQLKKAADNTTSNLSKRESLHPKVRAICRYCELVVHLIDSQRTQYLGKVIPSRSFLIYESTSR